MISLRKNILYLSRYIKKSITPIQDQLDTVQDTVNNIEVGVGGGSPDWEDIEEKPSSFPPADHAHSTGESWLSTVISNLTQLISGKANTTHSHSTGESWLSSALASVSGGGGGGTATFANVVNLAVDGGLVPDYVNYADQGTDQSATLKSYVEAQLALGNKRFYLPSGKYRVNLAALVNLGGEDIEIYGDGKNRSQFIFPRFSTLASTNAVFLHAGSSGNVCKGITIRDIGFVTKLHTGQKNTDGTATTLRIYPITWRAYEKVDEGQLLLSTDGTYLIEYTLPGITGATEPTNVATLDNGKAINIKPIVNRAISTAYTAGQYIKHADGEITYVLTSGTTSSTANPAVFGIDSSGGGTYTHSMIKLDRYCYEARIRKNLFRGLLGCNDAGASGINMYAFTHDVSGALDFETQESEALVANHLIEYNRFENFGYATAIIGASKNTRVLYNDFYQTGSWMSGVGFNAQHIHAHCFYNQGSDTLFQGNKCNRHVGGSMYKVHINPVNSDGVGHRVIGNTFKDYDFVATLTAASNNNTSNPDFTAVGNPIDLQSKLARGLLLQGNTYRRTKTVMEKYLFSTDYASILDQSVASGLMIQSNNFIDVTVFDSTNPANVDFFTADYSQATLIGNYISHTWSSPRIIKGCVNMVGNTIDYRGTGERSQIALIELYAHSIFSQNIVMSEPTGFATGAGVISTIGPDIKIDNNKILINRAGTNVVFHINDNSNGLKVTNNSIYGASSILFYISKNNCRGVTFENNTVKSHTQTISFIRLIANSGWRFKDNAGQFYGNGLPLSESSGNTSVVRIPTVKTNVDVAGYLLDANGVKATTSANIWGAGHYASDSAANPVFAIMARDVGSFQYLQTSETVAVGDWVTLSATAGKVALNGTSGATTLPASGFVGRVLGIRNIYTITSDATPSTAGTFIFIVNSGLATSIPYNVDAATLKTIIENMPGIGPGEVTTAATTGSNLGEASAVITISFAPGVIAAAPTLTTTGITGNKPVIASVADAGAGLSLIEIFNWNK